MPLHRRLPKRGFKSRSRKYNAEVRLATCKRLRLAEVDLLALKQAGIVSAMALEARQSHQVGRAEDARSALQRHRRHQGRQGGDRSGRRLAVDAERSGRRERRASAQARTWQRSGHRSESTGQERQVRRSASPAAVFLLVALVVYRIGTHIPVPGIDPNAAAASCSRASRAASWACSTCSRAARCRASPLFALGIMPYISASIIMQLMTVRRARRSRR